MRTQIVRRALGLGLALVLGIAACDGGAQPTGGAGGTGGSGGSGGAGGGGAGGTPCPAGSHAVTDGCDSTIAEWIEGPSLVQRRDHHVTFVAETAAGPFLYALAGASAAGGALDSVERSAIQVDGSLAAFEEIDPLPEGLIGPGGAADGAAIVIAGGLVSTGDSTSDTWIGQVGGDGTIAFTAGPPLLQDRYHLTLTLAGGFAYAIGGLQQSVNGGTPSQTVSDSVERAAFDGTTLSPFEALAPLPGPLTHHTAVAHAGWLYVIGGGSGAAAKKTILRAELLSGGDLGAWETLAAELPAARASGSTTVWFDHLFYFAGMSSLTGGEQDGVVRVPIAADGTLGLFEDQPALPQDRAHSHQTPFFAGFFYSAGGSIDHVPQDEVYVGRVE